MEKKLRKSGNKMVAGVCAGIAEYLDVDPTIIRVGYVLLSFGSCGFPGLLTYLMLCIIMPPEEQA